MSNDKPRPSRKNVSASAEIDSRDGDLRSHIEAFIDSMQSLELEPFSLMTPEDARIAAEMLEGRISELNQRMKVLSALKRAT